MAAGALNDRSTLWSEPIDSAHSSRGRRIFARIKRGLTYLVSYYAEHVYGFHVPIGTWVDSAQSLEAIESVEELEDVAHELPPEWLNDRLQEALRTGKVLLFLRDSPQGPARGRLIGLAVCEQGGELYTLGHRLKVSPKWLLTHFVIVHPEYRGQRKASEIRKLRVRYGHRQGISLFCGTIDSGNVASIRAHSRTHFSKRIVTVRQITLFGGKIKWTTSLRRIRDALARMAQNAEQAEAGANETTNRPDRSRS